MPKDCAWESPTGDNFVLLVNTLENWECTAVWTDRTQARHLWKSCHRGVVRMLTSFLSLPPLEHVREYLVTLSCSDVLSNSKFTA